MPRSGPSRADCRLIEAVAEYNIAISSYQLERWRAAGLLPRNGRRGSGRGAGSTSTLPEGAVAIATVLGRHSGQGRGLRDAVLRWWLDAGMVPGHGDPRRPGPLTPEPPFLASKAAMLWHFDRTQRLIPTLEIPLDIDSDDREALADELYAQLHRYFTRFGLRDPQMISALAELVRTGAAPTGSQRRGQALRDSAVAITLAQYLGDDELAIDVVIGAMAEAGFLPSDLPERMAEDRLADRKIGVSGTTDKLRQELDRAEEAELVALRELARVLCSFASLYSLLSMTGVRDPDLDAIKDLYRENFLGMLLLGIPNPLDPSWILPLIGTMLDTRIRTLAEHVRDELVSKVKLNNIEDLFDQSLSHLKHSHVQPNRR